MPDLDHLAALDREGSRCSALLGGADPAAPVPGCPGWDVLDLVHHLGRVHRWAASCARSDGRRGARPTGALPDEADLRGWFDEGRHELRAALADDERPCWTFAGPATVRWWRRRQALETLVHRVDLEQATGRPSEVDADLAADGVDEVVALLHPLRVAEQAVPAPPHGLALTSVAPHGPWLVAGPEPAAAMTGPPDALLLLLWRRTGLDDRRLTVPDRPRAAAVLAGGLTP